MTRYAQAVSLRLTVFEEKDRAANIEWARMLTPQDLREMEYICEGIPSDLVCGKAHRIGCQKELKKRFEALLQEYKS